MNQDDVTSLEELARTRAAKAHERHALLAAELYTAPRGLVTDAERSLLAGMIGGLVERVASRLDVAAIGCAEIVMETLRRAGVLADADLAGAAYHRLLEFDNERRATPNDILMALIADQDLEVIHAVTEYRVWRASRLDGYGHPVLDESDLPPAAVARLYWSVAAARGLADPAREDLIEAATLGELAALGEASETPPETAARNLVAAGLVGPRTLASLIEAGETVLAEAVVARLADMPLLRIRSALFEPGGETLAIAARAGGIDRDALAALIAAGSGARPRGGECAEAFALFDRLSAETAAAVLRRLRRHAEYRDAVRRLEGRGPA